MIIKRKEAIILSSFFKILTASNEDRYRLKENALSEKGLEDASEETSNYLMRKYVEYEFKYFSTKYIKAFLLGNGIAVDIKGRTPLLYKCDCCDYKTLIKKNEYFICEVCFWEDDGNIDLNTFSNVNKQTLGEAKQKFAEIGVVSKEFLEFLDQDRMEKFQK